MLNGNGVRTFGRSYVRSNGNGMSAQPLSVNSYLLLRTFEPRTFERPNAVYPLIPAYTNELNACSFVPNQRYESVRNFSNASNTLP